MEIEIKLNVLPEVTGGPAAFFARLEGLRQLGPFLLGPMVQHQIRDVYYDTVDRRLGAARVALRVRQQDEARFVTLKSPRRREGALAVRDESESPLSAASLAWELAALVDMGLLGAAAAGSVDVQAFGAGQPAAPLWPVLTASTWRRERAVFRRERRVAVLSLDEVRYEGPSPGPFYDVEAEAVGEGGEADLAELQGLLTQAAGGALAPGAESKLARGLRLAARE